MKRLIVCCDGTWNTPDQEHDGKPTPTNVHKLRNCLAPTDGEGNEQRSYYHPGVGTEGGFFSRTAGGAWGEGLGKNILSAYRWLAQEYEPGDAIYLFGFSRGAFTVRSLGGFLSRCGLLDLRGVAVPEAWSRVERAFERGYRERADWRRSDWSMFDGGKSTPIRFLGVWDTVGALGVPDELSVLNLFDNPDKWRFHDTVLGANVATARHALALDETRGSFTPTLWTGTSGRDVKQVWFPGVHSDVGGGYPETGLSDAALQWMIEEATQADLAFTPQMIAQLRPDPRDVLHNSFRGAFKALRSRPRNTPPIADRADVHASALERHRIPPITQAPYRPTRVLAVGQVVEFAVYAQQHWNDPGLYLEAGDYTFTAFGEWMDKSITCGPAGTRDGNFQLGEVMHLGATAWGFVERGWKKLTGNDGADFVATKRIETLPWFSLVGVITNDAGKDNPANDGSPHPHEQFSIGDGTTRTVEKPGHLFAFANDAWQFYGNNRGSVTLRVERTG